MRLLTVGVFFLSAWTMAATQIDGTWTAEMRQKPGKKGGGTERVVPMALNLKAEGGQLTGSVSMSRGKKGRNRPVQIQDGRIDGNAFSFTTVQTTKKGEKRQTWRGTIAGDEIRGSTGKGKRGAAFTAKRRS